MSRYSRLRHHLRRVNFSFMPTLPIDAPILADVMKVGGPEGVAAAGFFNQTAEKRANGAQEQQLRRAKAQSPTPKDAPRPSCETRSGPPEETYVYFTDNIELIIRNHGPLALECDVPHHALMTLAAEFEDMLIDPEGWSAHR